MTAANTAGSSTAAVTITVRSTVDTQPPSAPSLLSAIAVSAGEVDIAWTASFDNVGVTGYQVNRNGSVVATVSSAALAWADTTVTGGASYIYTVQAFDAAGNYSALSNSMQATTPAGATFSVTWYGACWQPATVNGITGNFQAMDFALTTSTPVPVQGTLFFAAGCDASNGQDNLNDFNTLTGSTHMILGFSHYPGIIPTSAYYWIGSRTADGKCPLGSQCSGCVNYNTSTHICGN